MMNILQSFTGRDVDTIHKGSMQVLQEVGVIFHHEKALEIFRHRGFRTSDRRVFFKEEQVMDAVRLAPKHFTLYARNPEKNLVIGGKDPVLLPDQGCPFVIDKDGVQRNAILEDYYNICKLVQTSDIINANGCLMVMPSDILPENAQLEMMLANIVCSDKTLMGNSELEETVQDTLKMLEILFGGNAAIKNRPVSITPISPLSPLAFSSEMASAIIELARNGQALMVVDLVMAGSSGPISLPGTIVVQNAEDLAGIVLAQLVNPGTPCVYGGCSSPMDMPTGGLALGAPEQNILATAFCRMAEFYQLPCKTGGALSDAFYPDYQAGAESAFGLLVAMASGAHVIQHAMGTLASYNATSLEKYILDEELCGMVKRMLTPLEISEENLALESIRNVGPGGSFLTLKETYDRCRSEFYRPKIFRRGSYDNYLKNGKIPITELAAKKVTRRLKNYMKPDIDPGIEKDLRRYVTDYRR